MRESIPNYRLIYNDILKKKFPEKLNECLPILQKERLSSLDVLELNKRIFGTAEKEKSLANQRCRSYKKSDILKILDYQKKNKLNNIQLANHFKLSRNTLTKWKKIFRV
ncbi:helix-turn-helix domain-containing protein [Chryseobacterium sp.]|uniref:helix-turn-helix domain-containing protein n=1 Tax=Chryseobacterium sp. TaxID=1871047 RepID=UPI0023F15795|nr:helix-turn-helix domain-containing protein [Chryseobacterium sp.]